MRVALFSDVHGNLTGLEAVLADIDEHAPDLVVFAGDLCLMGPRPGDCLRRDRCGFDNQLVAAVVVVVSSGGFRAGRVLFVHVIADGGARQ